MADIFISYAAEDRDRVESLVEVLKTSGLTVWWDRQIEAGISFDRAIEKELASAACVLVVWSTKSVESEWVREEADEGFRRGILIPIQIDECTIPMGFRRIQAAQLIGWPRKAMDLSTLTDRIGSLMNRKISPARAPKRKRSRKSMLAITGISAVVLLVAGYLLSGAIIGGVVMSAPTWVFGEPVEQQLSIATSSDGTRIAYAVSGNGPPLVYVLGWMTHLEKGYNSPVYDNEQLVEMTSRQHLFVRYDGRGFGLSEREVEDFSLEARVSDLRAVVDAAGLEKFAILAASSGGPVAVAFTAQYPDRVTALVLGSSFASTSWASEEALEEFDRIWDLIEVAWLLPPVSDMFADMILTPTGSAVDRGVLGSMLRLCCDGPNVANYFRITNRLDVVEQAKKIKVPTLVIQARDDQVTPLEGGRELASLIAGSRFEIVEGGHREGTASTAQTRQLVLDFLSTGVH